MFGLALGVEASDAGVELGSLMLVDPPRRYPFGQPVAVHPTGPALLQKMGVVIATQQRQVVKISQPTQDPIHNVVPVAPAGRMS